MHQLPDVCYLVGGLIVCLGGIYRVTQIARLSGRAGQLRRTGLVAQAHYINRAEVSGVNRSDVRDIDQTLRAPAAVRYRIDGVERDAVVCNRASRATLRDPVRVAVDARAPGIVAAVDNDDTIRAAAFWIGYVGVGVLMVWRSGSVV